jgi:hypothetical protein
MKSPGRKAAKSERRLLEIRDLDAIDEEGLKAKFTDDLVDELCEIIGVDPAQRDELARQVQGVAWWHLASSLPQTTPPSGKQIRDDLNFLKTQAEKTRSALSALNPETSKELLSAALKLDNPTKGDISDSLLFEKSLKGDGLFARVDQELRNLIAWVESAVKGRPQRRVHSGKDSISSSVLELAKIWVYFKNETPSRYDLELHSTEYANTPFAKFVFKALSTVGVSKVSDEMIKASIKAVSPSTGE